MKKYEIALEFLRRAEHWDWPVAQRLQKSGEMGGKFKAVTPKLLSGFITVSEWFGGTILDQFWDVVGQCDSTLKENIKQLESAVSLNQALDFLFEGIEPNAVDFKPVFAMSAELLTHLGVAFMNPGGPKSAVGTPFSVSEIVAMETEELLQLAEAEGFGKRKQEALKTLAFRRDGDLCPLTGAAFGDDYGVNPILAHVIPNSVCGKPDTMKCIAMLAGRATAELVRQKLNSLGNVMNLQSDAHVAYDDLRWGIETVDRGGEVMYIYRQVPRNPRRGPGYIRLHDGEEIHFGGGSDGGLLGPGPDPILCNLQLAVAGVLRMSGAAELIFQWKGDGDDSDFPHVYVASPAFCNILTAKLLMAGAPLVV